MAGIHLEQK